MVYPPPPHHDSKGNTDRDTGTPRWVKVFGIIAIVLVLLFVILLLTGRDHGPGRHLRSADAAAGHAPPERGP
jgi:hypothetical protein